MMLINLNSYWTGKMNLYTCTIDLKQDAKALVFSAALDNWMSHLQHQGAIGHWRLYRRKLNLATGAYRDFLLEVEVEDLAQLDRAFKLSGEKDDETAQLYDRVHDLIADAEFALYRPYPDPERAERMALI